ncbi:hypothetical protein GGR57DRAFT_458453 [Xylariaceae sp. FL1272]|nr:hypothetical protein GGR57DRAFT_458453 [Xylariaceae sp. FL1272]
MITMLHVGASNNTPPLALQYGSLPTIAQLTAFIHSIFPLRNGDTKLEYHVPRSWKFGARQIVTSRVILSITPTEGFYTSLTAASLSPLSAPLAFLHRPWQLDRRRVPRHATVLSCHKGFDEVLTVGNNAILASLLGMDITQSGVLQGYKGDAERTIGIVGPVSRRKRKDMADMIKTQFLSMEGCFGIYEHDNTENGDDTEITTLAIMNAFHPEEVERVIELRTELGLASPEEDQGKGVLYLTGAVREAGLRAALEKGMAVVCVGHRTCEEWGIRYLDVLLRQSWPSLGVDVVLEDEEAPSVKERDKVVR